MTPRQRAILLHVAAGIATEGRAPSYREIAATLGAAHHCRSISRVCREIEALTAAGWLRHGYNRGRDLEVLRLPDTTAAPLTAAEWAWCHAHAAAVRALIAATPDAAPDGGIAGRQPAAGPAPDLSAAYDAPLRALFAEPAP